MAGGPLRPHNGLRTVETIGAWKQPMPQHDRRPRNAAASGGHDRTAANRASSPAHPAAGGTYSEGRESVRPAIAPTYTVKPGDSLWDVAATLLGDGTKWVGLYAANRDVLPNRHSIAIGTVLQIPEHLRPASATTPAEDQPASEATPERTYTVHRGDNLHIIAKKELGDAGKWADLWKWNRDKLHNPNLLVAGMKLRLGPPNGEPAGPAAPVSESEPSPAPVVDPSQADPAAEEDANNANNANDTSRSNSPNNAAENNEGMSPDGPMAVGNTPLERNMARLWNTKGKFIKEQAGKLGIETAVAAAVLEVESNGGGFTSDGTMVIRFEKHIFRDLTGQNVWVRHTGRQSDEHDALSRAREINESAAYESISMGAAQIMGFNAQRVGYADAKDMYEDMKASEKAQLAGLFEFIRTSRGLMRAATSKNWANFAYLYNGPGYAANAYDTRMAAAYGAFNRVIARMHTS